MSGWNFADVWETVADTAPDAVAAVHGGRRDAWSALDRRADGVAATLLGAGLRRQEKVGLYLRNAPEYLETAFASMKSGLVPVNVNYRYRHDELRHLCDNADLAALVFHGTFTETVEGLRAHLPAIATWVHADDGSGACPEWAIPYEQAARSATQRARAPWGRSGDDVVLIYTGGTTGTPKGVIWRQHDLYRASDTAKDPPEADLDRVRSRLEASDPAAPVGLPAPPLMHGTAYVFAGTILSRGGAVVTLPGRGFDPAELLDAVERERVSALCIVGDAFCRPIVDALDREPDRWDLTSLEAVSSAGMMWSADVKRRLLDHAPAALLVDLLNSSEASGMGRAVTSRRRSGATARFRLGRSAIVIDEAGDVVQPGSGTIGRVAVRGHIPTGYYKEPERTAATFPVIGGVRYAVPGDYATVEADGAITLLGRGSTSINTGGEKVFPEEVEEALKTHPDVHDAVVVGIPDDRLGQTVAAAVQLGPGARADGEVLTGHVRERLAAYKAPRRVVIVSSLARAPNGKADPAAVREMIAAGGR